MMIIPAIDLMDGKVVRLKKGDPAALSTYSEFGDPVSVAKLWEEQGAEYIHIIDLDAAFGCGDNKSFVREMVKELDVPIQVGGGIRTLQAATRMLEDGIQRVILGSLAMENPGAIRTLIDKYGVDRVVVSLDYGNGKIRIHGWRTSTVLDLENALADNKRWGVEWFLVTSVERDGTLTGPDLNTFRRISGKARIIAAGGIRTLDDLADLRETGVDAAVVGKALYEGHLKLAQALSKMGREN